MEVTFNGTRDSGQVHTADASYDWNVRNGVWLEVSGCTPVLRPVVERVIVEARLCYHGPR